MPVFDALSHMVPKRLTVDSICKINYKACNIDFSDYRGLKWPLASIPRCVIHPAGALPTFWRQTFYHVCWHSVAYKYKYSLYRICCTSMIFNHPLWPDDKYVLFYSATRNTESFNWSKLLSVSHQVDSFDTYISWVQVTIPATKTNTLGLIT